MNNKVDNDLGVLLRSYEALYNWRALAMLAGGFALGGLAIMGASDVALRGGDGRDVLGALLGVLALVFLVVGVNGSGLMLADQAYGQPIRDFVAAFFGGLRTALAAVGALILLGLGFGVVLLAVFLLSLFARIPGIGGVFAFVFAGPSVAVMALTCVVLLLAGPLAIAAIWHGDGLIAGVTRSVTIVIKRPLDVFMRFLVLALVVAPAAMFIFSMISIGSMTAGSMYLAEALRGMGGSYGGMGGSYGGGMGQGMAARLIGVLTGHGLGAAGVSTALVWYLAAAVISLIYMLGVIFIHQSVSEGIGLEGVDLMQKQVARFKEKLNEHKPRSSE